MSKKNYTTFDIAQICDVQPATVAYWIEQGQLKAHKTPGGHRRVTPEHLFEFLTLHDMPLPENLKQGFSSKILVVQANKNGRSVMDHKEILPSPYEVKVAENRFQAGMLMASFKPNYIVLDMDTTGPDTISLCHDIYASCDTATFKVIVFAKTISIEIQSALKEAGVHEIIPENLNPVHLDMKIQRMLV